MRQKDRLTAVIEAKQGSRGLSDSSLSIKDSSLQSIASDSIDVDVCWKDEAPIVYSLEKRSMDFVNRTDAVKQLHEIHQSKFYRAVSHVGKEWMIPIAENGFGLGTSEFGRHYIRKSRETWPDAATRDTFQQMLCNCHTIVIEFHNGALLEDTFNAVMIKLLCMALKDMFLIPPAILSTPPKIVHEFLKNLTEVAGPVFIVLDEIGKAFQNEDNSFDDSQQRDKFISFCDRILDSWFSLKKVFFVVVGHASFLDNVGRGPTNMFHKRYEFKRLNIHQEPQ
ncbi:hypothetical protein BJ741DRAFT_636976 [Chytriomyces cf. hyalinus JEL632]|nr:hypothetical protein BJ741DRAFT_636976 [Chytriomyces cf. hyalinus JEL632]